MKKLTELLRLKFAVKLTHRQIGRALNISPGTVSYYVQAAVACGISWPLDADMDNAGLMAKLEPHAKQLRQRYSGKIKPNWDDVKAQLNQKHMTLALIWENYAKQGDTYSYAQFTRLFNAGCKKQKITLRQEHKPGDKAFIDYAGSTVPIYDAKGDVCFQAQLFIMALGASDYTFACASASQKRENFIQAHVQAFHYFGGVPRILVPDNLKSGITDSCQFEPLANPAYADMAEHYGCAIIPARPYKPQDKAKAESAVLVAQRFILARLNQQRFYSLQALNEAIAPLLDEMNKRPFQKREGSRYSQFLEQEKPALKALPKQPYTFTQFSQQCVAPDYHVRIAGHYYSVPYTLVGEAIFCRYSHESVEIFHQGKRVATHARSLVKDSKTTLSTHMPHAHWQYNEWTPQVFLDWAHTIGAHTLNVAKQVIATKKHPEQCSKIHLGLRHLAKRFGAKRLDKACQRALAMGCVRFKSIESILSCGLDKTPLVQALPVKDTPLHAHVRGANYYQQLTQGEK